MRLVLPRPLEGLTRWRCWLTSVAESLAKEAVPWRRFFWSNQCRIFSRKLRNHGFAGENVQAWEVASQRENTPSTVDSLRGGGSLMCISLSLLKAPWAASFRALTLAEVAGELWISCRNFDARKLRYPSSAVIGMDVARESRGLSCPRRETLTQGGLEWSGGRREHA